VVALVEFDDHHDENMKDFFQEHYPYVNRDNRSEEFAGNVIFSKYPITNLIQTYDQSSWRYGYVSIQAPERDYYLYLVHTSAPISRQHFSIRNNQLDTIVEEYAMHAEDRDPEAPILMVGDFNLTPRSPYYKKFQENLPELWNATRSYTFLSTW